MNSRMPGHIREQLDTVFRRDPAARSVLEIVLCYPGFHAVLLHRVAHHIYGSGWFTPVSYTHLTLPTILRV